MTSDAQKARVLGVLVLTVQYQGSGTPSTKVWVPFPSTSGTASTSSTTIGTVMLHVYLASCYMCILVSRVKLGMYLSR